MSSNQRYSVLLVDDDLLLLKNMQRIFQNHYDVRIAVSAEEGIKALKTGFTPAVIVADHIMPKVRGSEFLKLATPIAPSATRILLVGHYDIRDIVTAVAEGGAYMYLTKPFLDTDLVQAVKIGIDYHKQASTVRAYQTKEVGLVSEVRKLNGQLQSVTAEKNSIFAESLRAIGAILSVSEKYYFNDHSRYVSAIAMGIADLMRLRPDVAQSIHVASQVHNVVAVKMPDRLKLISPFDMTSEEDLNNYLKYYNESLSILAGISAFKDITPVVSQINEHYDGTGLPNRLSKGQIFIESQIIAVANVYHNKTYLLEEKKLEELQTNKKVTQTVEETERRHRKALQFLQNRASWFDDKILKKFQELVEADTVAELRPYDKDLTITIR